MPLTAEPKTRTVEIRGYRFKIRELTIGEYDELEEKATTKRPNPVNADGPQIDVTDRSQLLRMMVIKAVVEPHLTPGKLAELPLRVALGLNDVVNGMHFPDEDGAKADLVEIDPEDAEDEEDEKEESPGEG